MKTGTSTEAYLISGQTYLEAYSLYTTLVHGMDT